MNVGSSEPVDDMGLRWTRFFGRISKTLTSVGASGRQMAASAPREALKSASARAGRRQSPDTTSHCRKCRRPRLQPQPPLPLTPPSISNNPTTVFFSTELLRFHCRARLSRDRQRGAVDSNWVSTDFCAW